MADDPSVSCLTGPSRRRVPRVLVCILLLAGLILRLAAFLNQDGRLTGMFPTEDGYLTLTIARNIAIGLGMSTAAGTLPTNGTQPLVTLLWAVGYWAVGGDKVLGIVVVLAMELVISCLTAWVLYRLGRRLLSEYPSGAAISALAAGMWFANPFYTRHAMNCLETGANALAVVMVAHVFISTWRQGAERWSITRCVELGALMGLAFWVRNDGCFLVLAGCLTRWLAGYRPTSSAFARRTLETVVMGGTALAVACPWLLFNRLHFGYLVPISGIAEARFGPGRDLGLLATVLGDYVLALVPVSTFYWVVSPPRAICIGEAMVAAVSLVWLVRLYTRAGSILRVFLSVVGLYALALIVFYGLYFGVPYFLTRFLFPLSAFLALLWSAAALGLWDVLRRHAPRLVCRIVSASFVAYCVAFNALAYATGGTDRFFNAVRHLEALVSKEAWIGGFQTGIVGYFHDRTINLDGKVNADALRARLDERLSTYIVNSRIDYVFGWEGISGAIHTEIMAEHFEPCFRDPNDGFGLLRRRVPRI
jgi:hypothetical protein